MLDDVVNSKVLADALINLANKANASSKIYVLKYVFLMILEILGITASSSSNVSNSDESAATIDLYYNDKDAFGIKHCHLFTIDGNVVVNDALFSCGLHCVDIYVQKAAALSYASLLSHVDGNIKNLLQWTVNNIARISDAESWSAALSCLYYLVRTSSPKKYEIMQANIVQAVSSILRKLVRINIFMFNFLFHIT